MPFVIAIFLSEVFCACYLHIPLPASILILFYVFVTSYVIIQYNGLSNLGNSCIVICGVCIGTAVAFSAQEDTLTLETWLGLGPQYALTRADPQRYLIPLVYAIMHSNLLLFGLLPLTMCNYFIQFMISLEARYPYCMPRWNKIFHLYHMLTWHRMIGYSICGCIYTAGILWWLAMYYSCSHNGDLQACTAFLPKGSFCDIRGAPWFISDEDFEKSETPFKDAFEPLGYAHALIERESGNGGAVIFLRILIILTLFLMAYGITRREACYELFFYGHVIGGTVIAVGAFFSRMEVFYSTFIQWVLLALNFMLTYIFTTPVHWELNNNDTMSRQYFGVKFQSKERIEAGLVKCICKYDKY